MVPIDDERPDGRAHPRKPSRHGLTVLLAGLVLALVGAMTPASATPRETPVALPTASSTGVPSGVSLRPSGSLVITRNGTTIDGLRVDGTITVDADNVTIRNTLVQGGGDGYPIRVTSGATSTLIEHVEVDNEGSTGVGIYIGGSSTVVRNVDIHSAEDGIRIEADNVVVEHSYVHDLTRYDGGHHDCIQIRSGDNVTVRYNTLQAYVSSTRDPMNAAIQIGSLVGRDRISNLQVIGNLMNGGNYTVNGGGRGEVDSARYSGNRFGRNFRYDVAGNLQNSVWTSSNVWDDTSRTVRPTDVDVVNTSAILAVSSGGSLYLYPSDGSGGIGTRYRIGNNWNVMTLVTGVGDLSGDGYADLVARDSDARLWLYRGDSSGGFMSGRTLIGGGWHVMNALVGIGDLSGDGRPDVVARDISGRLWLYPGTASGRLGSRTQIGHGWASMSALAGPGDVNGDGRVDLVARSSGGTLYLYPGTGSGRLSQRQAIGGGWNIFNTIIAPGDISGDGFPDLIGRKPDGTLHLYTSNGRSWRSLGQIGHGWSSYRILGPGAG